MPYCKDCGELVKVRSKNSALYCHYYYMIEKYDNCRDAYGNPVEDPVTYSWMNYGKRVGNSYIENCPEFKKRSNPSILEMN